MTKIEGWVEIVEPLASGETRACAVAGVLAELGVTRLVFATPRGEVELLARVTDLPGVLEREPTWTLRAEGIGVEIERHGATWRHHIDRTRGCADVEPALMKAFGPKATGGAGEGQPA